MRSVWVPLLSKGVAVHLHHSLNSAIQLNQAFKSVTCLMDPNPVWTCTIRQSRKFLTTPGSVTPIWTVPDSHNNSPKMRTCIFLNSKPTLLPLMSSCKETSLVQLRRIKSRPKKCGCKIKHMDLWAHDQPFVPNFLLIQHTLLCMLFNGQVLSLKSHSVYHPLTLTLNSTASGKISPDMKRQELSVHVVVNKIVLCSVILLFAELMARIKIGNKPPSTASVTKMESSFGVHANHAWIDWCLTNSFSK